MKGHGVTAEDGVLRLRFHARVAGVDSRGVKAYEAFVHILDEQLSQAADVPSGQGDTRARVATPAFWGVPARAFLPGRLRTRLRANLPLPSHVSVKRDGSDTTTRPIRPRRLTSTEWNALRQLQRLGAADLGQGFSDHQLRRAFRALAKRLHPDRHPGSSPTERERLASAFATVVDAYRELTSLSGQAEPAANHR